MLNLEILNQVRQPISELGLIWGEVLGQEAEPGLGNDCLVRLTVRFLDSMATLAIPSLGYRIRYVFGIFIQDIVDVGRKKKLTNGGDMKIPGIFNGPNGRLKSSWADIPKTMWMPTRKYASMLNSRIDYSGKPLRYVYSRLPQQYCQHPSLMEG